MMAKATKPRLFYGWWIVAATAGVLFVSMGIGYYMFPVLFKPWITEFGWSRVAVSGVASLFTIITAVLSPVMGRLCDRYGPRKVMLVSAIPFGAGILLLSQTSALWYLYVVYAMVAIGIAGMFTLSSTAVVTRWFIKKRGTALGITVTGMSLGGLVIPPLVGYLIPTLGWRMSLIIFGLLAWLILLPLLTLVIRSSPRERGLLPDGEQALAEPIRAEPTEVKTPTDIPIAKEWTAGMALRTSAFWAVAIAYFLIALGMMGVLSHQTLYITDMGVSLEAAATALGFTSGMAILGKLASGYLADRLPKVYLLMASFGLQVIGVVILMQARTIEMIWLFAIVFGFAMGATVPLRPALIGELFGSTSFASIFGWIELVRLSGGAIGPLLAGFIFDIVGSYQLAFTIFIIISIMAIVAIFFVQPPWRKKAI